MNSCVIKYISTFITCIKRMWIYIFKRSIVSLRIESDVTNVIRLISVNKISFQCGYMLIIYVKCGYNENISTFVAYRNRMWIYILKILYLYNLMLYFNTFLMKKSHHFEILKMWI